MKFRSLFIFSLLVTVIFLASAPYALKYTVQSLLEKAGAQAVTLHNIDFDLFKAEISIKKLQFHSKAGEHFALDRAMLNIDWLPLLKRRIDIQKLTLSGLHTTLEWFDNDWLSFAGLSIEWPPNDANSEAEHLKSATSWQVAIQTLAFEDIEIRLKHGTPSHVLRIDTLTLNRLIQWFPGDIAAMNLQAYLDDTALTLAVDMTPFYTQPVYTLRMNMDNLDLVILQLFTTDLAALKGDISAHGDGYLALSPHSVSGHSEPIFRLNYQGDLQLKHLALPNEAISLSIDDAQWQGSIDIEQGSQKGMQIKKTGRLNVHTLVFADTASAWDVRLNQLKLNISDLTAQGKNNRWTVQQQSTLQWVEAMASNGLYDVTSNDFKWSGRSDYGVKNKKKAELQGNFSLGTTQTTFDLPALKGKINAHGDGYLALNINLIKAHSPPHFHLKYQGELQLKRLDFPNEAMSLNIDDAQWQGSIDMEQGSQKGMQVKNTGHLNVRTLVFEDTASAWDVRLNQLKLNISDLTAQGKNNRWEVQQKSTLQWAEAVARNGLYDVSANDLKWSGRSIYEAKNQNKAWLKGDFLLGKTQATLLHPIEGKGSMDEVLGRFEALSINALNLTLKPDLSVQAQALSMQDLALGEGSKGAETIAMNTLNIDGLRYQGNALALINVTLDGGQITLHRDKNKHWNIQALRQRLTGENVSEYVAINPANALNSTAQPKLMATAAASGLNASETVNASSTSQPSNAQGVDFNIEHMALNNIRLRLKDDAVTPAFSLKSDFKHFDIRSIDSQKSEQASVFDVKGSLNDFSEFSIKGDMTLFSEKRSGHAKIDLKALDLPPFSTYIAPALGTDIKSGALTSTLNIGLQNDTLEGLLDLTLRQLKMGKVDKKHRIELSEAKDLSLNSALKMLRDKHNTIHLKIPIAGDLSSPEFNYNDALRQASKKATKMAALKYLTATLQPYGTWISLAKFAGKQLMRLRLKPVMFQAGSSQLPETAPDYLAKIARVLEQRPELAIMLCGITTAADRKTLLTTTESSGDHPPTMSNDSIKTWLNTLVNQRTEAVKRYLVNTLNAPNERLVGCQPDVDKKTSAQARVELLI